MNYEREETEPGSVSGGWLGTYAYRGALRALLPVRFEATLGEPDSDGNFSGTILDDGGLGDATVAGGQSGRGIRFSKIYRRRGQPPIFYEGTLAEDGRTMEGTWRIADQAHGVWDARRLWSENRNDEAVEEGEAQETEHIREVVRLG